MTTPYDPKFPEGSTYCWRLPACVSWQTSRDDQWDLRVEAHPDTAFVGWRYFGGTKHCVFSTEAGGFVAVLPQNCKSDGYGFGDSMISKGGAL